MDQEKKIKIILVSVFIVLLLGVGYLFLSRGSSKGNPTEVSARAIDSAEVSITDIMSQGDNAPIGGDNPALESNLTPSMLLPSDEPAPTSSEYESSEEITKLQTQLRANLQQTQKEENNKIASREEGYTNPIPAPRHFAKHSEVPQPPSFPSAPDEKPISNDIEEASSPQKRSRFNSGLRNGTRDIRVLVLGEQELKNNSPLKMVLAQSIVLEGTSIPKGTALYGIVHSTNGRMNVSVASIRYREHSFSVSLNVYDRDGLMGINIQDPDQKDNTAQEIAEDVSQRTGIVSGTLGNITSTISGIFRKKGASNTIVIKSNYQLSLR